MYPTTDPLGRIARPATDALSARLGRQNRSGSGITAIDQGNGTPFLTNRPETVDELPDEVVRNVITGGPGGAIGSDPRAMLKAFITGNDNVGRANATNRDFAIQQPEIENKLRADSMARGHARVQKRADTNEEAATAFDKYPMLAREAAQEQARAIAEIGNQGDYAKAGADRYTADTTYDVAAEKTAADADANDFKSIMQSYGDALTATAGQDPEVRDAAVAPIKQLLIQLLQGRSNAATQRP